MTDEQRDYLAQAPTNADGDPVDYEGNALLPELMNHEQLVRLIDAEPGSVEREHEQGQHATAGFAQ